jgi:hypothetical protein
MVLGHSVALLPHQANPPPVIQHAEVSLSVDSDGDLVVHYECVADGTQLRLPAPATPGPADELWRHTCCELFIADQAGSAYREFNFSPSGQWAVYDFAGYRERRPFSVPGSPRIAFARHAAGWSLAAEIPHSLLPVTSLAAAEISLTLVVESEEGALGYWALRHPREIPDFHDRAGFILRGSMIPGSALQ